MSLPQGARVCARVFSFGPTAGSFVGFAGRIVFVACGLWVIPPLFASQQGPTAPLTSANALPGEGEEEAVFLLPEVLVRASRSAHPRTTFPTQVTVLAPEDLARTGERTLPRQIAKAAGIWVQETNLGGGAPILRGLVGNQVLLVVDGVRLTVSTTRTGPNQLLNSIDPAVVERVEVLRGPGSVMYGSDALGGVIVITTKRRRAGSDAPALELEGDYATNLRGGRASLAFSDAGRAHGWLVTGSVREFGDVRAGGDERQEFTGYGGFSLFSSTEWDLDPLRTLRLAARFHRDEDVPRTDALVTGFPTSPGGPPTPPSDLRRHFDPQQSGSLLLAYEDRDAGQVAERMEARLSLRFFDERRERITVSNPGVQREEADEVVTAGLAIDWQRGMGENRWLTWGIDLDHDWVDSTRDDVNLASGVASPRNGAFAPGSRYFTSGAFARLEWLDLLGWDWTFGARYAWHHYRFDAFEQPIAALPDDDGGSGSFGALTGSLSAARDLSRHWRFGATFAQGYRAPNLQELAAVGGFFGGTELPGPDLDPERSVYGELALEARYESWRAAGAVFAQRIDDLVGRKLDPDASLEFGEPTFRRENQGKLLVWGFESLAAWRLFGPQRPWELEGRVLWTRGRQYDDTIDPNTGEAPFDGVDARRIPPLTGSLALVHLPAEPLFGAVSRSSLSMTAAARQDKLHPDDVSDPRIDPEGTAGWARVDLSFEGPLFGGEGTRRGTRGPTGRWVLGIENLLDQRYRVHASGYDAPGVGLYLGMSLAL